MMKLVQIARDLAQEAGSLQFEPPVTHVYNPLEYAWAAHKKYLERYGKGHKEVILLGMNPGPFGMAQTGVPFGEVAAVRDWLGIEAQVGKPEHEHPKRPILGLDCPRSEVSGARLYGWARKRFGTPTRFFQRFFIVNYCPLVFLEESGRNRTPDKLKAAERRQLLLVCDRALRRTVELLAPQVVVGVGVYARDRALAALEGLDQLKIGAMLHPSPASPKANRGWASQAEQDLADLGVAVG